MDFVDLLSRWLHVGTAITLLGGTIFMRFVLVPAANQLPDDAHQQLRQLVTARWKRFVHLGILLFLLTGFYNYLTAEPAAAMKKQYHMLMGIKILLAFGIFGIASVLVGRSSAGQRMRNNPKRAMGLIVLLGLIILGISGYLKVQGLKLAKAGAPAAVAAPAE